MGIFIFQRSGRPYGRILGFARKTDDVPDFRVRFTKNDSVPYCGVRRRFFGTTRLNPTDPEKYFKGAKPTSQIAFACRGELCWRTADFPWRTANFPDRIRIYLIRIQNSLILAPPE